MAAVPRALVFALFAVATRCACADVLPGEWDIATTVSIAGQPGSIGPMHQTQCLGASQAADPAALLGPMSGVGAGCALSDKSDNGSSLSFHITCKGPFSAGGSGAVRYGPDHAEGDLQLRTTIAGQQFDTRSHVEARRTGPCQ